MHNLSMFQFIILALAAYRLTHLIVFDTIAEPLRRPFIRRVYKEVGDIWDDRLIIYVSHPENWLRAKIGQMLACYWCAGIWVAAVVTMAYLIIPNVTLWVSLGLAIASIQSILETFWTGYHFRRTRVVHGTPPEVPENTNRPD